MGTRFSYQLKDIILLQSGNIIIACSRGSSCFLVPLCHLPSLEISSYL